MFINYFLYTIQFLLGWPFILYVTGISLLCTLMLKGVQFRQFIQAAKITIFPPHSEAKPQEITSLQAFLNTLNTNLGNGTIAGMAVAVTTGGPGAGLWLVVASFLLMAVRFAEVYLSTWYGAKEQAAKTGIGGPMLYLEHVPAGTFLAYLYAALCLSFGCIVGNAMQANSISLGINYTWHVPTFISGTVLGSLVLYILLGGAKRIIAISDALVPIKVLLFFFSTMSVLIYNYATVLPALYLIVRGAFNPMAVAGGMLGFTLQQVIRVGINQSIVATESGLGSAAIFFGATGSKDAQKNALLGMMSTFVSTLVCFIVVLAIIASGVWQSGLSSTPLTIAAYGSLFGYMSGWIVSFLSISFGLGVLVAYAYVTRVCWLFLTNGKFAWGHLILYVGSTLTGALIDVKAIWMVIEVVNALIIVVNLFGIMYLLPGMVRHISREEKEEKVL